MNLKRLIAIANITGWLLSPVAEAAPAVSASAVPVPQDVASTQNSETFSTLSDSSFSNLSSQQQDSIFFENCYPIYLNAGSSSLNESNAELRRVIEQIVPKLKQEEFKDQCLRIRCGLSPEGRYKDNKQLSTMRQDILLDIFEKNGISLSQIIIDPIDEDYELLIQLMKKANDPDLPYIKYIYQRAHSDKALLKRELKLKERGALWKRLSEKYFPQLRAARFMIVPRNGHYKTVVHIEPETEVIEIPEELFDSVSYVDTIPLEPIPMGIINLLRLSKGQMLAPHFPDWEKPLLELAKEDRSLRRELISLKSNLLQDLAYMPQYGFCPLWNIAAEFYPLRGHYTAGVQLDIPWWTNRSKEHKYFEARNWQLFGRRYFGRESGEFRGPYAEIYGHVFKYGIGFTATKGWQGEGFGGGIGAGYVWNIGQRKVIRKGDRFWTDTRHWRIEAGIQAGYFITQYDPYVYGDPVDRTDDHLYYYDYKGKPENFRKRQYRYTWMGPTRIGISISYDILYRRGQKGDVR